MAGQDSNQLKVVVAGGSGETGKSIVNALLASPDQFNVTLLARATSVSKVVYQDFSKRGADVKAADFQDINALVPLLQGADVVISCLRLEEAAIQNNLIDASSKAKVGRFVPSFFATVCPPRGVMWLRDQKEAGLDRIKSLYLPYTAIDVGWWMQISIPRVPSGKFDGIVTAPETSIGADGNVKTAFTDLVDVGRYVARIIADPRTLNKQVFVYGEVATQNVLFKIVERFTAEKVERKYMSKEDAEALIKKADEAIAANANDVGSWIKKQVTQYKASWGIRGDNTPEHAAYLGYLDAKELYPDFRATTIDEFVIGLVEGTRSATVYAGRY